MNLASKDGLDEESADFVAFFSALTGHTPRAYQVELAKCLRRGEPPSSLVVGTGLGKTLAVLVGWLWALATDFQRGRGARRVPLRLFMVVDRRVVVDGTYEAAQAMVHRMMMSDAPVVVRLRQVLQELGRGAAPSCGIGDEGLMDVVRLRGSLERRSETTRYPFRPLIAVGTIDMIGSRLLYRSYVTNPARRSIEAALVGLDSLLVLDEAHLAEQAATTLRVLQEHQLGDESRFTGTVPGRQLMAMSATPISRDPETELVADMDRECTLDPGLRRRMDRRARMRFTQVAAGGRLPDVVAQEVCARESVMSRGRLLLVFTTTVKDARTTVQGIRKRTASWATAPEVHLVTGGMPEHATRALLEHLAPFMTGGQGRDEAAPTIVVSTSTLEVGADLDADILITAPADETGLVQRSGRTNRVGARESGEILMIVPPDAGSDPIYGDSAQAVLEATARATTLADALEALQEPAIAARARRTGQTPAILPRHVFEAYRRTAGSRNDLPVSPWLRPIESPSADVSIVFRDAVRSIDDEAALLTHLALHRPDPRREAWTVNLGSARSLLTPGWMTRLFVMDPATLDLRRETDKSRIHPGDVLILPPTTATSLLGFSGLERDVSDIEVDDRAAWEQESSQASRAAGLPGRVEKGVTVILPLSADELTELIDEEHRGSLLLTELSEDLPRAWTEVSAVRWDDRDSPVAVTLDEHGRAVGEVAEQWARLLGLPEEICQDLGLAGLWHDRGKATSHTQRLLAFTLDPDTGALIPGAGGPTLGKSALPRAKWRQAARLAGVPEGFRHEAASAELFDEALERGDVHPHQPRFVRHLILSHHGHFRGPGPLLAGDAQGGTASPTYQTPGSGEWCTAMEDFRDLEQGWGPYTLSLAETILRLADWHVSEAGGAR